LSKNATNLTATDESNFLTCHVFFLH
jgi:hypothetical protein